MSEPSDPIQEPSDPASGPGSGPGPVRPFAVWFISGWYFMSGFFSISIIAAARSRIAASPSDTAIPLPPLETGDLLLAAFLIALNLSAAGFLFLMKKTSVIFFKAALAVNVGTNVWYLFHRGAGEQPAIMYLGVIMGWLVAAAVCRYAAGLERKGVLR